MHSAQELVSQITALAPLPTVYIRVREVLGDPDGSLVDVSNVVASDPALSARLLKLVNSAAFGFSGKIDTVHRAVSLLGLHQLHDMVLAMSLSGSLNKIQPEHFDINRFWRNSMLRGLAARHLAVQIDHPTCERLLVVGLLGDIGQLIMQQVVPKLYQEALRQAGNQTSCTAQIERTVIGCDRAELGATLAAQWQLPACFAEIIGAQNNPRLGGDFVREAALLQIANHVVACIEAETDPESAAMAVPTLAWTATGLSPEAFGPTCQQAGDELSAYLHTFFPNLSGH